VSDTINVENREGILTASSSTTKEYVKSGSGKSIIEAVMLAVEVVAEDSNSNTNLENKKTK
jgi:hypothetical protein